MATHPSPAPPDPALVAQARSFLDRLIQKGVPRNHVVPDGVEVLAPRQRRKARVQRRDPVATVAMDPDGKAVEADVAVAMSRIRGTLATLRTMRAHDQKNPPSASPREQEAARLILDGLHTKGRDKVAYATFALKGRMDELLDGWDESWTVENTVGLLIDMSLATRAPRARKGDQPGPKGELMSPGLMDSRGGHHDVNKQSAWYQGLPENAQTHSGASATTAQLLLMLEDLDVPLPQVEAVMNGLVRYWGGVARKVSGNYHTAAEIWAVYNEHLESRLRLQWAMNKQRIDEAAQARVAVPAAGPVPRPKKGGQAGDDDGIRRTRF